MCVPAKDCLPDLSTKIRSNETQYAIHKHNNFSTSNQVEERLIVIRPC